MSHVNGGFDFAVEWEEGLCEDFAVGGFEVGFGVGDSLGGVVLLFGSVAPEVRGNLRFRLLCHFQRWRWKRKRMMIRIILKKNI